jgi:hypothetical protein
MYQYPTKLTFQSINAFSHDEVVVTIKQLEIRKEELYEAILMAASEANINKIAKLTEEIKPIEAVIKKFRGMIQ